MWIVHEPSKMLRVSPKSVLEKFLTNAPEEPLRLKVKDALLPENSGVYTISTSKAVSFDPTGPYDVEISIQALAQLITGRFSAQNLYHQGELLVPENGDISFLVPEISGNIAELDNLFPKVLQNYLLSFFAFFVFFAFFTSFGSTMSSSEIGSAVSGSSGVPSRFDSDLPVMFPIDFFSF